MKPVSPKQVFFSVKQSMDRVSNTTNDPVVRRKPLSFLNTSKFLWNSTVVFLSAIATPSFSVHLEVTWHYVHITERYYLKHSFCLTMLI